MRTASRLSCLVTALAALEVALACAPSAAPQAHQAPAAVVAPAVVHDSVPSVPLIVDNKDYYDFEVFVLTAEGGMIRRVGIAPGLTTTNFVLTGPALAGRAPRGVLCALAPERGAVQLGRDHHLLRVRHPLGTGAPRRRVADVIRASLERLLNRSR